MNSIEIVATGKYVPSTIVSNNELEKNNNLDDGYIYKRTGIENRHYIENETLEDIAILSVKDMLSKNDNVNIDNIGLIITASTTFDNIMPSLSFSIQNYFNIKDCMCLDVLAGCSGFINALDIAQKYVSSSQIEYALIVGAEVLSKNNYKSINEIASKCSYEKLENILNNFGLVALILLSCLMYFISYKISYKIYKNKEE